MSRILRAFAQLSVRYGDLVAGAWVDNPLGGEDIVLVRDYWGGGGGGGMMAWQRRHGLDAVVV